MGHRAYLFYILIKVKNFSLGSYLQPNCFIHDRGSRYILKMLYSANFNYITIEGKNFHLQPSCFTHDRGNRYILKM